MVMRTKTMSNTTTNAYEDAAASDELTEDELIDLETLASIEAHRQSKRARDLRRTDPRNTEDIAEAKAEANYFRNLAAKLRKLE